MERNNEKHFIRSYKTVICLTEEENIGDFSKEITGTEVETISREEQNVGSVLDYLGLCHLMKKI